MFLSTTVLIPPAMATGNVTLITDAMVREVSIDVQGKGSDPRTSVLNEFGQAWHVKNLFVTDGATFVSNADKHPTLSILALAWRRCPRSPGRTPRSGGRSGWSQQQRFHRGVVAATRAMLGPVAAPA
jgi:hypothetical protein